MTSYQYCSFWLWLMDEQTNRINKWRKKQTNEKNLDTELLAGGNYEKTPLPGLRCVDYWPGSVNKDRSNNVISLNIAAIPPPAQHCTAGTVDEKEIISSKGVIEITPPPIEQIQLNKLMNYVWLIIDGLSPWAPTLSLRQKIKLLLTRPPAGQNLT